MRPDDLARALQTIWADLFGRSRKWSTKPVTMAEWCELGERVDILIMMNQKQLMEKSDDRREIHGCSRGPEDSTSLV
jgi:hypothetical protein